MTYQVTASEKVKDLPLAVFKLTLDAGDSSPSGICQCGCGWPTSITRYANKGRGLVAGRPARFIRGHNSRKEVDIGINECGCWIWLHTIQVTGYGYLGNKLAHRLTYERWCGPVPEGLELDHLCRNRACVNPDHLEPVTRRENVRRGLCRKLTAQDVKEIRASSEKAMVLAKRYGIGAEYVGALRARKYWKDVA